MATFLNSGPALAAQGLFEDSTVGQHTVGEYIRSADGRSFRYAQTGAVALVRGTLLQAPIEVSGNQNLTAVAAAAGALSVAASSTVTVTANQYAGGYVLVTITPDLGGIYMISNHAAYTTAAPTLNLSDPIVAAWTTSTRFDLVANPYGKVLINAATAVSGPVGAAVIASAISSYSWIQTHGAASVLNDSSTATGLSVVTSASVAGAVKTTTSTTAGVGYTLSGITTAENGPVFLLID